MTFPCYPDRPDDNGDPVTQCPTAPASPSAPSDVELNAYRSMHGPFPPSDYEFEQPGHVVLNDGGSVVQVGFYRDGKLVGRGLDRNGDGVLDTYVKLRDPKTPISTTTDTNFDGTLDERMLDTDNDGKADSRKTYP